jgi:hypothetical protein
MAFFWTEELGMVNLRDFLLAQGVDVVAGWTRMDAYGVSGDGSTIVGAGINPAGNKEAWVARIPEPAGFVLGALGILGAVCLRALRRIEA